MVLGDSGRACLVHREILLKFVALSENGVRDWVSLENDVTDWFSG